MALIEYVPILPYPSLKGDVHHTFGYDMQTKLPYILEVNTMTLVGKPIDTVWGVEGFAWTMSVIILPCSLHTSEIEARLRIDEIILVV